MTQNIYIYTYDCMAWLDIQKDLLKSNILAGKETIAFL